MSNKVVLGIIFILIFLTSVGIGFYIVKIGEVEEFEMEYASQVTGEKVTDECTDEAQDLLLANSSEQKVSPNAIIIAKRHYAKCGHTTKEYLPVTEDMVNLSKSDIEELYKDWKLEGFSSTEIVVSKEEQGICKEHYVLREEDERIVVYTIDENNNEKIFERTGIITKYLPEADKINIENGIFVNGKEALNCLLEDYE